MKIGVLHLIQEEGKAPICGTLERGYHKGFWTNLHRANFEVFNNSMERRDIERCLKCQKLAKVKVPFTPYKPERHFKIPFSMKSKAKNSGMWWSPESKTWFIPSSKSHYHTPAWASKFHTFNKEEEE